MQHELILLMGLALALGFKHSYDADHLVAVSNLLARSDSIRRTSLLSTSWAAGHMLTASVIAVLLYAFREALLSQLLANPEVLVAAMLILLGVIGLLWEFDVLHRHEHRHGPVEHRHVHLHLGRHGDHGAMFSIGVIHGMASNDEILVLFVVALGVTSLGGLLAGIAVFSVGVVIGMVVFGLGLSYPILRWGQRRVRRIVNVAAALLSIAYAALLLAGHEGWNPFSAFL
jgi:uncharacterized membrane protein YciS (DUF1049 family)